MGPPGAKTLTLELPADQQVKRIRLGGSENPEAAFKQEGPRVVITFPELRQLQAGDRLQVDLEC